MFFIGIFSSIIPYLIIAGIYLVGIGMYSLENRQVKWSQTDSQESVNVELDIKKSHEKEAFPCFESNNDFGIVDSERTIKPFAKSGKILPCSFHSPPQTGLLNIIYFCRPPPLPFIF